MKKLRYFIKTIITAVILQAVIFIGIAAPVYAAAPVCYQREPANYVQLNPPIVTRVLDCGGNPNFHEIEKNVRGHDLSDDTCYIIQAGVNGITNGDPFGSDICNAAEAARIDKGTPVNGDGTPTSQTPAAPTGSTGGNTGGGATTGATATTGSAPNTNNPSAPSPTQPAIADRCTTVDGKPDPNQTGCGFEGTNNCDAGNQGKDCSITDRLQTIANFLSAGVGIIIVIMLIIGGIQYTTAGGDPGKVAAAKNRILNAIYALIAFFFLYSFLQWIIPGGIF